MTLQEQMELLAAEQCPKPSKPTPPKVETSRSDEGGPEVDLLDALALLTRVQEVFETLSEAVIDMPLEVYEQLVDVSEDVTEYLDAWDFREEDK